MNGSHPEVSKELAFFVSRIKQSKKNRFITVLFSDFFTYEGKGIIIC